MHRNGSSPLSQESSSFNSPYYRSYLNGNSPTNNQQAVSPHHYAYSGGISPNRGPRLVILNQPQKKFRFRYISEMSGTHGCLMGETNEKSKKEYIRVLLEGCPESEAIVRCTLVTNHANPVPHVHRLSSEGNGNGGGNSDNGEYQDIAVSKNKNDWIASFSGLTIIHTAKKNVRDVIERRLITEAKKKGGVLNYNEERKLKDEADRLATTMDLHSVKLKFEAFVERNGREEEICPPVYSTEIQNLKSTQAGDLRIVRIDKVCSVCTGQEEIFIFVEKVNKKDIKVRFFEVNDENELLWEDYADFSELDVHHQYAIAFKTPPYKDLDIKCAVNVLLQLFRPSNSTYSEPRGFTYTPREDVRTGIKRPRLIANRDSDYHSRPPVSHPSFPTNGSMNFESPSLGQSQPRGGGNYSPSHQGNLSHGTPVGHNLPVMSVPAMPTVDMTAINFNQQHPPQHSTASLFPNITERGIVRPQTAVQFNSGRMSGPGTNIPINTSGLPDYSEAIELNKIIEQQNVDDNLYNFLGSLFGPQSQQPIVPIVPVNQEHLRQQQPLPPPAPISSLIAGLEQPEFNIQISPVDIDNNEDLLLELFQNSNFRAGSFALNEMELEEYVADASCPVDRMTKTFQKVQISVDDAPAETKQQGQLKDARQPASSAVVNDINSSALFSNYSLNLAYALRHYAETGDLPHILRRMIHLLALQSDDGDNALHDALFHNQIDVVRAMLKAASDSNNGHEFLNAQNNSKQTPLHISVLKNQTEAVALLLQSGTDPSAADMNGNSPIHLAAADTHLVDCLHLLLHARKAALKLNQRNYAGLTPLHMAVNASNLKAVEMLVAKGSDVNCHETKRGRTALHLAVKRQASDIISLLLRNPALDVNRQSYDGNTALNLAKMDGLSDIGATLMHHGADPQIENYLQSKAMSESGSESDDDDGDEQEEGVLEVADEAERANAFDFFTLIHPSVMNIVCEESRTSERAQVAAPEAAKIGAAVVRSEVPSDEGCTKAVDSGIDLMASRDLSKDLSESVIEELARLLDNGKDWERLAEALDIGLCSMRAVFDKQTSPTTYLLRNLDLWDLTTQTVLEKLQQLYLTEAFTILENHIHP